jgi:hypothetical protein
VRQAVVADGLAVDERLAVEVEGIGTLEGAVA